MYTRWMPNRNGGVRVRARCAEGKRTNEWVGGWNGGGVGRGGKEMNRAREKERKSERTNESREALRRRQEPSWLWQMHLCSNTHRILADTTERWHTAGETSAHRTKLHTNIITWHYCLQTEYTTPSLGKPLWFVLFWDSCRHRVQQSDSGSKDCNHFLHWEIDSSSGAWTCPSRFSLRLWCEDLCNVIRWQFTTLATILMQCLLSSGSQDALWMM